MHELFEGSYAKNDNFHLCFPIMQDKLKHDYEDGGMNDGYFMAKSAHAAFNFYLKSN